MVLGMVLLPILAAACGVDEYRPDRPDRFTTAANCLQSYRDNLQAAAGYAVRTLTVATGDPGFPPWWEGGTTDEHPDWKRNDPYLGRGYEGAVTFEVAERMGVPEDRIRFVPFGYTRSFAPGPKPFDFAVQQISYLPERAKDVAFSEGYLDVDQALVSVRGSTIATATSIGVLTNAVLGAASGTTSLAYLEDHIRPTTAPTVFEDLRAAVRGLRDGEVDGIVVDLPSATMIAERRVPDGVLVGRLPAAGSQEHFAMAFQRGSPIVQCVDLALREMKADGTLDALRRAWLPDASGVPLIGG